MRVDEALGDFRTARSTYFSRTVIGRKTDKYATLLVRVKAVFEESKRRYGSESIWAKLR